MCQCVNVSRGNQIQVRPSQSKFNSLHTELEVIRASTFLPASLNRQAITLLSTLTRFSINGNESCASRRTRSNAKKRTVLCRCCYSILTNGCLASISWYGQSGFYAKSGSIYYHCFVYHVFAISNTMPKYLSSCWTKPIHWTKMKYLYLSRTQIILPCGKW